MKYKMNRTMPRNCPAYPNAASSRYYFHKALDVMTAILSGMGLLVAIVFLAAVT